jgi:hypothetical protein
MKFVYVDESRAADHTDDPAQRGAYETQRALSSRARSPSQRCVLQNLCRGFQAV